MGVNDLLSKIGLEALGKELQIDDLISTPDISARISQRYEVEKAAVKDGLASAFQGVSKERIDEMVDAFTIDRLKEHVAYLCVKKAFEEGLAQEDLYKLDFESLTSNQVRAWRKTLAYHFMTDYKVSLSFLNVYAEKIQARKYCQERVQEKIQEMFTSLQNEATQDEEKTVEQLIAAIHVGEITDLVVRAVAKIAFCEGVSSQEELTALGLDIENITERKVILKIDWIFRMMNLQSLKEAGVIITE